MKTYQIYTTDGGLVGVVQHDGADVQVISGEESVAGLNGHDVPMRVGTQRDGAIIDDVRMVRSGDKAYGEAIRDHLEARGFLVVPVV